MMGAWNVNKGTINVMMASRVLLVMSLAVPAKAGPAAHRVTNSSIEYRVIEVYVKIIPY